MPTFEVQANGKTYEVDAPSVEAAAAALQGVGQGAPAQQPAAPAPPQQDQQPYSGSVLPFTRDAGGFHFDSNAGVLGMAKRALTLPGDVYSGQTPVTGADGRTNPEVIQRSADLGSLVSGVNPAVRAGDLAIPGASRAPMVPETRVVPPTATALKDTASAGYDAARNSGVDVKSASVANAARSIQSGLENDGIIAELAPKTFAILGKITSPPEGSFATIGNIEAVRRSLQLAARDFGNPTEQLAASRAIKGIDGLLEGLSPADAVAGPSASPEAISGILRDARGNYAAAQRSNSLTGELDRANTGIIERAENRAQAANSGRNLDNTIRQKVASLLEKPKEVSGFSDSELGALNDVVEGGPVRNSARYIGNLLGGGGGMGQAITAGLGAAGGAAAGGPVGAVVGAVAPPVAGALSKTLANMLAKRSLSGADEAVRMNSPLYRQLVEQAVKTPAGVAQKEAMARALLGSILAQPQQ